MRGALLVVALAALRCAGPESFVATGGNAARGRRVMETAGCGACHMIPGVRRARGVLAAPLTGFARRSFIGGEVPNTPDNLIAWLRDPRSVEPRTAMPNVGLSERQARDVAAYLYELR